MMISVLFVAKCMGISHAQFTTELTGLNALVQSVSRRRLLVPQFLVDFRREALGHPVVVLRQVGVVRTCGKTALSCHS